RSSDCTGNYESPDNELGRGVPSIHLVGDQVVANYRDPAHGYENKQNCADVDRQRTALRRAGYEAGEAIEAAHIAAIHQFGVDEVWKAALNAFDNRSCGYQNNTQDDDARTDKERGTKT